MNNKKRNFQYESKLRREAMSIWYVNILKTKCCAHCGNKDYRTFDWHHLDPNKKDKAISKMLSRSSKEKILAEMSKCIVLCKNCHAILHYEEKGKIRKKKWNGPVFDI